MANMIIKGSTILITGGTGTFGKAFARYALDHEARQVRIFSRDELKQSEMEAVFGNDRLEYIIGDVRDEGRIIEACKGVDIVVHAAAMKRLETCERQPLEAVKTNITGSANVAKACKVNGVQSAISLSSDKAVNPVNAYGKTKSLMENIWIQSNHGREFTHSTRFSMVRYGNVIGSRGSVADIFRKQIKEQGKVFVTDPGMTRFFMPVSYATQLVDYAICAQQGGEIYVPGLKATTIGNLAKIIAEDKHIVITQPRAGEKIHEDIITEKESLRSYLCGSEAYHLPFVVVVIDPESYTWPYTPQSIYGFNNFSSRSCDAPKLTDEELEGLLS